MQGIGCMVGGEGSLWNGGLFTRYWHILSADNIKTWYFSNFPRRKKAWCWNASGFSAFTVFTDVCFRSSWATDVHLWRPCLSLEDPFAGTILQSSVTPQMQAYNSAMSEVHSSVEWLFGDVINYFKFRFQKNLKIELSSVGKMYVVCALLRNALTYLYGNQTSDFFELDPPSLQDYFA